MSVPSPLHPIYLIGGTDAPKIEFAVRRLRERVTSSGGSVEHLQARLAERDGEGHSAAEVVAECNMLGLFGGTRLLLVTGAEAWASDKATVDLAELARYAADPAGETVLALISGELARAGPLAKLVERAGQVLAYDLPARDGRREWVRKQAAVAGLELDASSAARLLERAGDDAHAIASEIAKLASWSKGEAITPELIDELCVLEIDTPPWDLTDAVGERRPDDALAALGRLLDDPSGDVARWLPALARQVRQLATAQRIVERGGSSADVAKALGMRSEFAAKKLARQATRWSEETLGAAIVRVALAERETRGESVLRDRFALERGLVESFPAS